MEAQFRRAMGLPRAALRPQTVLELSGSVVPFYPASLIRCPKPCQRSHHQEQSVRRRCLGFQPASADVSLGPNPC